ncbi:MAG: MFS transporter [Flavisolibacter sp.]
MENIRLGLKENARQFSLLVVINAFVGGMVGLERSILPRLATENFHLQATSAVLSFIIVFGITKALTNYFTGALANRMGRKNLLTLGWVFALPVPFMLMSANHWSWIIAANVLLGINQGLTWSSTVVMKIDLVGEKQRGFAMGLNEFSGYVALAATAFLTGWIASRSGLRPYPFYVGIVLSTCGLLGSLIFIKDTRHHIVVETKTSSLPRLKKIFWETTWKHRNLGSVTQAGLINNLNDGMAWGILPILLASKGFGLAQIGMVTALYPAIWGVGQIFTGKMADHFCKKHLLFGGMLLQGLALTDLIFAGSFLHFMIISGLMGLGTALVYPAFLATVADNTHPEDRAHSLGIFRFWRDMGYAIGAFLTGVIADALDIQASILLVGLLTLGSAGVIYFRMYCGLPLQQKATKKSGHSFPARRYGSFTGCFRSAIPPLPGFL